MVWHGWGWDGMAWQEMTGEALKDLGTESSKQGTNAWVGSVPATEKTLLASALEQLQR